MTYLNLVKNLGGRSHLTWLAAFITINVAFYTKVDPVNFIAFAGIILSLCGIQNYRSIKSDQVTAPDNTPNAP